MMNFTGERVVPGQVSDDLWAEHISRYEYASKWARHAHVLDIGCGTGYGTARLAGSAVNVTGIDTSHEAIAHAREVYPAPNISFACADAAHLPFAKNSYHLITAFEVIEHMHQWREMLQEAHRVLRPDGVFFVSTPNRTYYTQSRGAEGPNPFHVHEFDLDEFSMALSDAFPYSAILLQNQTTGFAFYRYGGEPHADAKFETCAGTESDACFFLGVCAHRPLPTLPNFVYIPRASNALKDREQHIHSLVRELTEARRERDLTMAAHETLSRDLGEKISWAQNLDAELASTRQVLVGIQRALNEAENTVIERTTWAHKLDAELASARQVLVDMQRALNEAENTVIERTIWAQQLDAQVRELTERLGIANNRLAQYEISRWIKFGRMFGLGPNVSEAGVTTATEKKDR
jgi:SAM-dependent methyltransferase